MSFLDPKPISATAIAAQVANPASVIGSQLSATIGTQVSAATAGKSNAELPANRADFTMPRHFDPTKFVYGWGGLKKWRAALARAAAGDGFARVLCVGDSITFGANAKPTAQGHSYPNILRNGLDAKYGAAGTGAVYLISGNEADDTRFVRTSVTAQGGYGPFNVSGQKIASGGSLTFTAECDSFTVMYVDRLTTSDSSFAVSIDGGAVTTVAANKQTTNTAPGKITFPAGAHGTHTITIGSAAVDGVFFVGIEGSIGRTGVRVTRMGVPGALSGWAVGFDVNLGSAGASTMGYRTLPPDLTVVFFGHNEYITQRTIAGFKSDMQNVINVAKENGDVLLVTTVPNNDLSKTIAQLEYDRAIYDLAQTNTLPVLDVSALLGSYATSSGLYSDNTHPNNQGYALIGQAVADVIASAPAKAPALPTPYAADMFNRADGVPGSTTIGAKAWTATNGTVSWAILNKKMRSLANSGPVLTVDTGSANGLITTTAPDPTISGGGLVFRYVDDNNYWFLWCKTNGAKRTYSLHRKVTGGFIEHTLTTTDVKLGDVMQIQLDGPRIQVIINHVVILDVNHTFQQTATKHGLYAAPASNTDYTMFSHTTG